jgi:hypothetical protein
LVAKITLSVRFHSMKVEKE